ncbi:S16 family serine protease [Boudabousia marimammalium]|uniref:Lon proteolytic domain-containing protein n=1 Tax=Boudabousia marimammalium TaxID=156892 RepID=A0A1Q5PLY1_9ACTO|nr:S16 family serine protease [Boudabousia marimammalium]OKL48064.1 hypothetical protein BM477_06250 [Boudabousia marimammalium]
MDDSNFREAEEETPPVEVHFHPFVKYAVGGIAALALIAVLFTVTPAKIFGACENYLIATPAPSVNLIDQIHVSSAPESATQSESSTPESDGAKLFAVGVLAYGFPGESDISLSHCLLADVTKGIEVEKLSPKEYEELGEKLANLPADDGFAESVDSAFGAAFSEMGLPYSSEIVFNKDSATGVQKGDQLVGVVTSAGEHNIGNTTDLAEVMQQIPPATKVQVTVKRNQGTTVLELPTVTPEDEVPGSRFADELTTTQNYGKYHPVMESEANGPSGGLAMALTTMHKLGADLLGKDYVAVTGAIRANGMVAPIGGIVPKIYAAYHDGAKWFLAPDINCNELKDAKLPEGITPVRVKNLKQAAEVLRAIKSGQTDKLEVCPHK